MKTPKVGDFFTVKEPSYSFHDSNIILKIRKVDEDLIYAFHPKRKSGAGEGEWNWWIKNINIIPEEIYNSPLWKLMKEDE